jgi:type I restriction enzyme, R subunit
MSGVNESAVEMAALAYFRQLGYRSEFGPNIAPGEPAAERESFEAVLLYGRLRDTVQRINPGISNEMVHEAIKILEHRLLTRGVPVEYRDAQGAVRTKDVWLIDFDEATNNDWLALNQYTIVEGGKSRRPDVVVFLNGRLDGSVDSPVLVVLGDNSTSSVVMQTVAVSFLKD